MKKYLFAFAGFMVASVYVLHAQSEAKQDNCNNNHTNMEIHVAKVDEPYKSIIVAGEGNTLTDIMAINLGTTYELWIHPVVYVKNVSASKETLDHLILKNPYILINTGESTIDSLKSLDRTSVSSIEFVKEKDRAVERYGQQAANGAIIITTM